jgi:hypothetical protein
VAGSAGLWVTRVDPNQLESALLNFASVLVTPCQPVDGSRSRLPTTCWTSGPPA